MVHWLAQAGVQALLLLHLRLGVSDCHQHAHIDSEEVIYLQVARPSFIDGIVGILGRMVFLGLSSLHFDVSLSFFCVAA